jgi:putative protein kinase ArgK-like GTPase of G3E family
VRTIASEGKGVSELAAAIANYEEFLDKHGLRLKKKIANWRERLVEMLRESLLERVMREQLSDGKLAELASAIAEQQKDPYSMVEEVIKSFRQAGRPRI